MLPNFKFFLLKINLNESFLFVVELMVKKWGCSLGYRLTGGYETLCTGSIFQVFLKWKASDFGRWFGRYGWLFGLNLIGCPNVHALWLIIRCIQKRLTLDFLWLKKDSRFLWLCEKFCGWLQIWLLEDQNLEFKTVLVVQKVL